MKKLILLLPAVLILTSCSILPNEQNKENDLIIEENLITIEPTLPISPEPTNNQPKDNIKLPTDQEDVSTTQPSPSPENTSTLTWGLDAYVEPGKGISEVVFEFYDNQGIAAAYHIKNKGALLAKGFVLGIQFEEIFKDNLFFDLASNANEMASYVKEELIKLGVNFTIDSPTNQLFARFDKLVSNKIMNKYGCELWENNDDNNVIRFVTSYKTSKQDCDELIKDIASWLNN
jgi:hypothetical protein